MEEGFQELTEAHLAIGDMVDKEVFRAGYYYNLIEALKAVGNYVYQAPDDEKIILTADHGEMITKLTVGAYG